MRRGSEVSQPPVPDSDSFIDYGALRALVVDDSPGMRNALRLTLSNFGITKIQMVANAAEAIFQIKNRSYDFILCDFNLGVGRDGQQLLEELRHGNLIALETVFMMVTAESYYEKVVATAELAPDDYMIKPFSAELLCSRLTGILLRKRAFRDVYWHFQAQDLEASIAACDALIHNKPKYAVDALRFKGELLVALGRFEEFRMHARAAVNEGGFTEEDLKEIVLQQAIYCGVPAANTAFEVLRDVVK